MCTDAVNNLDVPRKGSSSAVDTDLMLCNIKDYCKEQAGNTIDFTHAMTNFTGTDVKVLER